MAAVIQSGTPSNGAAPAAPLGVATPGAEPAAAGGEPAADLGEDALLEKALGELNGEEPPAAQAEPEKPKPAPAPKKDAAPDGWDEAQASRAFAKLSAEQKRFDARKQEQSQKYLADVASFEAKQKAFEQESAEWRTAVSKAKDSPLQALKALGWTYDQLVQYVAKEGVIPSEKLRSDLKLELDEVSKSSRAELEAVKKELAEAKAERERQAAMEKARTYETSVYEGVDAALAAEPEKFRHLARIPAERRNTAILNYMVAHYEKTGEALAISDAMLYGEQEAKEYASWYASEAARQEGAVQSANPGAAKPETEARPISQRDQSVRGVQKDPDEMTDEEREQEALRILASG